MLPLLILLVMVIVVSLLLLLKMLLLLLLLLILLPIWCFTSQEKYHSNDLFNRKLILYIAKKENMQYFL